MTKNEGNAQVGVPGPHPVAYGSLIPKAGQAQNLLMPVMLSASHITFGSIRMESVFMESGLMELGFMELGQAAGRAASMALEAGGPVQEIDVEALQRELHEAPFSDGRRPPNKKHCLAL
jgi:hypothetical protein